MMGYNFSPVSPSMLNIAIEACDITVLTGKALKALYLKRKANHHLNRFNFHREMDATTDILMFQIGHTGKMYRHKKKFNDTMDKLSEIDSRTPTFRLK